MTMKEFSNDTLIKLLSAGIFPNNKNRVWTMCQVALKLATKCVEEAEKFELTDEQFFIAFEDALNVLSVKDHTSNKQFEDFKENIDNFYKDDGLED